MKPIQPDCSLMAKEVRRQLALNPEDLARELCVSYATVNRWENGQVKPSKFARAQLDAYCERDGDRKVKSSGMVKNGLRFALEISP